MILIAEDNPLVRKMIRDLIEDIDAEIIECEDGNGAIESYKKHRPDFVLMDIHMTPVDCLTATSEILSLNPEAKIIAVTQYQDTGTREAAMAIGMCAFVSKDDLMSLRSLIRRAGEHRSVGSD